MLLTVVLEKTLKSPLDSKDIQSVHCKGNQCWIFIGRTEAEAETPILWPPEAKSWLIRKDPNDGKDWRQKEKGTTKDEMIGWPYFLNGHEFEKAPGDGEGQRRLACCSPWGHKELEMTEWLNNNKPLHLMSKITLPSAIQAPTNTPTHTHTQIFFQEST